MKTILMAWEGQQVVFKARANFIVLSVQFYKCSSIVLDEMQSFWA